MGIRAACRLTGRPTRTHNIRKRLRRKCWWSGCLYVSLHRMGRAFTRAAIVTGVWGVVMLIPGFNIIGLIIVMLPLWMLHDAGLHGLGDPKSGFFVPTALGYFVGAFIIWLEWFLLFLATSRSKGRNDGTHS